MYLAYPSNSPATNPPQSKSVRATNVPSPARNLCCKRGSGMSPKLSIRARDSDSPMLSDFPSATASAARATEMPVRPTLRRNTDSSSPRGTPACSAPSNTQTAWKNVPDRATSTAVLARDVTRNSPSITTSSVSHVEPCTTHARPLRRPPPIRFAVKCTREESPSRTGNPCRTAADQ